MNAILALFLMLSCVCTFGKNQGNACNNTQDLAVFKKFHDKFHAILEDCSKKNIGDADKTAHCLAAQTNNTIPCAECFGEDSHCAAVHCSIQCLKDPDSKECLDCVQKNCYKPLLDCAGVDPSVIPPQPYVPPRGNACNNTQDVTVFKKFHDKFHAILEDCSKKNIGDADKTAHCLAAQTNNTIPCAECFGEDSHCAAVHCSVQCLKDPDSKECLDCVQKNCYKPLLDCSGVDPSVLPP